MILKVRNTDTVAPLSPGARPSVTFAKLLPDSGVEIL